MTRNITTLTAAFLHTPNGDNFISADRSIFSLIRSAPSHTFVHGKSRTFFSVKQTLQPLSVILRQEKLNVHLKIRRTPSVSSASSSSSPSNHDSDPVSSHSALLPPWLKNILAKITLGFPFWVLIAALVALRFPYLFAWFKGSYIVTTLAAIMLGMGLTLSIDDFKRTLLNPIPIILGAVAQFTIMPSLGFLLSTQVFRLPTDFITGVVLVACCPGGTASNLVCFLGGADVPLSVLMTLTTTTMAVVMTPLLMKLIVGAIVPVSIWALMYSTFQIVILPLTLGLAITTKFKEGVDVLANDIMPCFSTLAVALLCASIVAANATALLSAAGLQLLFCVLAMHAGGFALGYLVTKLLRFPELTARTVSIEVGMQNSSLGAALASAHFAASPLTALPSAISATTHSILGSLLAGLWYLVDRFQNAKTSGLGENVHDIG